MRDDEQDRTTLLHRAAASGKDTAAWSSIAHGADVNSKDRNGKTPLHYAAENGYLEIAEMLVSAGANLNLLDHTHQTPIAHAQKNGNHEVLGYLKRLEKQTEKVEVTLERQDYLPSSFFWIDAICIDQANPIERGHQVSFMDRIFKNAACVFVWLGTADPLTETAFSTVSELATCYQLLGDSDIIPYEENSPEDYEKAGIPYISLLQWNALAAIYCRQWFTRAWILQEAALATSVMVFCGVFELQFNDLAVVTEALCRRYKAIGYPTSANHGFTKFDKPRGSFAPYRQSAAPLRDYVFAIEGHMESLIEIKKRKTVDKVPFEKRGMLQGLDTEFTLLKLLHKSWPFDCHDPRDKIYCLLGLVSPNKDSLQLYPDYTRPVAELYAQVTKHFIEELGDYNFLTYNHDASFRKLSTLPSWVPDFSVLGTNDMWCHLFDASGERLKSPRFPSTSWDRLGVTGIRWDTVVQRSDTNKGANTPFYFDPAWYEITMQLDPVYATGQHRTEVLWRTLCMNQDVSGKYPAPDEFKDQFHDLVAGMICVEAETVAAKKAHNTSLAYNFLQVMLEITVPQKSRELFLFTRAVNEMEDPPDSGIWGPYFDSLKPTLLALDELATTELHCSTPTSGDVEEFRKNSEWRLWDKDGMPQIKDRAFMTAFGTRYSRRRLIRTEKNFLGVGSASTEIGDEVWILAGAYMPFILRKSDTGRYRLVGAVYIHGIMHGEAVQEEDLDLINIELE